MGKHSVARGRKGTAGPIATAGLASIALAGAGVMLLLGPDSPTMRSVTADVRLVNTEGPSSDSGSDTGNPPSASENTSTPGTKPKADKPRLPSLKQVQDRLSERATEATKHLNDFTRNGVQRAIDNAKANGDKETRSPQRRHKSPAAPKTDSTDKAEAPDTSTASESQQNTTPGHRLREIADRVTEALPRPSGDKPQNTPPAESSWPAPRQAPRNAPRRSPPRHRPRHPPRRSTRSPDCCRQSRWAPSWPPTPRQNQPTCRRFGP
ncbi:hypothetical protein BN970_01851 [Mycolicibacterium conceptionense]|uniref:Uncharacterized protein n=1 Tax=Mycolicibacterium conceptionense TaxID=451644 RepID=A0A0U1D8U5_9MYCO|nr:hypothetical protein BN970_01851 [Mycolicibacterium conceptionense]